MMLKRLLLSNLLVICCIAVSYAQLPPPCPSSATPPSDFCNATCIYCDFSSVTSTTSGYTGQTPPGGFCSGIQNESWLGFIANCPSVTFIGTPSNCANGDGIQIAVYSSCDGAALACNGGSAGGGTTPVSVTAGTTAGSNYFLLVDGYGMDQCDYTITALPPGCAGSPNLLPTLPINGPSNICPGGTAVFTVPVVSGAAAYIWEGPPGSTINGQPTPVTLVAPPIPNSVTIVFPDQPTAGVFEVCVQPINTCAEGTRVCKTIVIQPIPPTVFPNITVCQNDLPYTTPWGLEVTGPGLYQETVQSYLGCDSTLRQVVTVSPPIIRVIPPISLCAGESISVCGNEYSSAGSFTETCTAQNGCDSIVTFTIINVFNPVANIMSSGNLSCTSSSVNLSAQTSPASSYQWLGPHGFTSGLQNITVSQPGTYILNVAATTNSACSISDTIVISGNSNVPTVAVTTPSVLGCTNTSTTLTASSTTSNATFQWSGAPAGPILNVTTAGLYTVTVSNPTNGCSSTSEVTVTGNTTPPGSTASSTVITCANPSSMLTATSNVPSATFAWSNSTTGSSTSASTAGTYTVLVTDPSNGCTSVASTTVTTNTVAPNASANGATITCGTPSVNLTASSTTSGVTYQWTGGPATSSYSVSAPGTYTVVITNPTNGCTSTASATALGDLAAPGATAAGGTLTCTTTQTSLSGGSPASGVTYAWSGPGGFSSTTQNPVANTVGNYIVTVTGLNQCTSTATAVVDNNITAPSASATGGIISCSASSVTINASAGTPGASFEWSYNNTVISSLQNPSVTNTGTYTVVVTNPTNGCTASATATVTPDAGVPVVDVTGGTITCTNASVTITGSSSTPGATFSWTSGPGGFTPTTASSIPVTVAGSYTLVATNPANGCTAIGTAVVDLDTDAPNLSAAGGNLTCLATNLQLAGASSTPGVTYSWSGPDPIMPTSQQNPLITDPGTYVLVVTNPSNGCTASTTAQVQADTNAPTASSNTGTLTCAVTSLMLNGTATGPSAVPASGYLWTTPGGAVVNSQNISATTPGNYVLSVTSANGCSDTYTAVVAEDVAAPGTSIAPAQVITCASPSATLVASSPLASATYVWSTTAPGANLSVTSAGTYTVTATDPGNGCTSTASQLVSQDTNNPTVTAPVPGTLTCRDTIYTINSTATVTGGSTIDTYSWTGPGGYSSTLADPVISAPGTYSVLVTASNGCTGTANVVVPQNITAPIASATGATLTCVVTSAPISGNSNVPGSTFSWSGPGFTSMQQNPTIQAAGVYILEVTAPNGCTGTASATVDLNGNFPTADLTVNNPTLTCALTSATINVSSSTPGVTYSWSTGSSNPSITVGAPANYTVSVTAPNGCVTIDGITVDQDIVLPGVTTVNDSLDCISGQATLQANSAVSTVSYAWSGPLGFISTIANPTVTNAGTYTIVVTNTVNGCSSTGTAQAIPNTDSPQVATSPGGTLTCATTSLALSGSSSTAGATGIWTGPGVSGTSSNINVSQPGNFVYTVTATNGCISSASVTVSQNIAPPANAAATAGTLTCTSPSLALGGSTSTTNVTYAWSGPGITPANASQQNPTVNQGGLYVVTITGSNGCTSTASATMQVSQDFPIISSAATILTCTTPSTVLNATSPTTGVNYGWTGPNGFTSPLEDPSTTVPGVYTVQVTAPNGCTATSSVTVDSDQLPPANVTASGDTVTCTQPTVTITAGTNTTGVTYQWLNAGGTVVSTQQNPSVSQVGTYTVVVTGTNGCTATAQAQVVPDASIPQLNATGGLLTCAIQDITIQASSNQQVSWSWTGPNGYTSTVEDPTVTEPGSYTVLITATNGCTVSTSVTVTENVTTPAVSIQTPAQLDCNTEEVTISASVSGTSSYTYAWSTIGGNIVSGGNSSSPLASQAGQYILVVTDTQNGCTDTESTAVSVDPNIPQGSGAILRDVSCFGSTDGAILIDSVTGGAAPYLFSIDGRPYSSVSSFTFLSPGPHTITIQDANGCEVETVYQINEPDELFINIGTDTTIRLGEYIDINLNNLAQYVSEPGRADTFLYTPSNFNDIFCDTCLLKYSVRYTVTVQDSNGCSATDDRLIKVDRTRSVVVPNVVNPISTNGNDIFTVYGGIDVERVKSFRIYDRWGDQIFERLDFDINENFENGWNGKFRAKDVTPGVYVYWLDILFKDGESEIYKGDVSVVR